MAIPGELEHRVIQGLKEALDTQEFRDLAVSQVIQGRKVYLDIQEFSELRDTLGWKETLVNPAIRVFLVLKVSPVIQEFLVTQESLDTVEYLVSLVIPVWTGRADIVEHLATRVLVVHRDLVESKVSQVIAESQDILVRRE